MQHLICIQHTHQAHIVKIKSLGKHLGADQHIQLSLFKTAGSSSRVRFADLAVSVSSLPTLIPSNNKGKFIFDLLGSKSLHGHVGACTGRTGRGMFSLCPQ